MGFTADFIEKVRREFPGNNTDLLKALYTDDRKFIDGMLAKEATFPMSLAEIIKAIDENNPEKIKQSAERLLRLGELSKEIGYKPHIVIIDPK